MGSFEEALEQSLTPAERVWHAIAILDVLAHDLSGEVVHDAEEVIGVAYPYHRGLALVQDSFDYYCDGNQLLPRFSRSIQTVRFDMREAHILETDDTTTTLLRNGMTRQGGPTEITQLAKGLEGIISRITLDTPTNSWWIRVKTTTE